MTRAAHQDHPCAVCGATPAMYGFGQMAVRRVSVQGPAVGGPAPAPLLWGCGAHRGEVETLYWSQIGGQKSATQYYRNITGVPDASAKPAPTYSDPIPAPAQMALAL